MIPPAEYLSKFYDADFRLLGQNSLCGANLFDMMRKPKRSAFRGFPEFILCQFALNLHNQAFYSHFPNVHHLWCAYSAPFGNTLHCFSGHGLANHIPDSILHFVQEPRDPGQFAPVSYDPAEAAGYVRFFFGDYLQSFAASLPEGDFAPEQYLEAISKDVDCRMTILTEEGWRFFNVARLASGDA